MIEQDSTDPTGIAAPERKHGEGGGDSARRARDRKSNAALQMVLAGATWDEVALSLGYPTARQALVAVEKSLEKQLKNGDPKDREKMRELVSLRLDRLLRGVWGTAIDPKNPNQIPAVGKAREIVADYRKLHGLDAPTEVTVHTPTMNELEAWVNRATQGIEMAVEEADIFDADIVEPREIEA